MADWMKKAACRQIHDGVADWFADRKTVAFAKAVAICQTCPVRSECLAKAEATEESFGVWGGLDAVERERRRRRQPVLFV